MFIWTISDAIGVVLFVLVAAIAAGVWLTTTWRQRRCQHTGQVNETRACDAICADCGKNLGFIGAWRAARATGAKP